jgi:hypothetical protein
MHSVEETVRLLAVLMMSTRAALPAEIELLTG